MRAHYKHYLLNTEHEDHVTVAFEENQIENENAVSGHTVTHTHAYKYTTHKLRLSVVVEQVTIDGGCSVSVALSVFLSQKVRKHTKLL